MKKEILKLLNQLFVKKNKQLPMGVEAAGLDMRAEKIAKELSDVGYQGPISLNFIKRIEQAATPTYTKVWPKTSGEVFDLTGKKIHPGETIIGGKGHRVEMSADDYAGLKEEWFGRIIANTNDDINTFLKKGINQADERFINLSKDQRKDFLDMVQYRIKHGNKKFMNDFTDAKGEFKLPEDLAYGGLAGMLGERTGYNSGGPTREEWLKILKEDLKREFDKQRDPFPKQGDKEFKDFELKLQQIFAKDRLKSAGGGLAPMLGEPTYADGGRTGFKGKKFDPSKRKFLKTSGGLLALLATLPGIGKIFKPFKTLTKSKVLTQVPIKDISGMPPWFKPFVNKVIKEGEEISSHGDRIITHKAKLPNSKTDVYVTQDLNSGDVVVDIGTGKHGFADGHLGQPVRLEYRASEEIPLKGKKGSTKTKEEFTVEEAEFTGGHPENVKFEESTIEKFGDHGSNFDEVEKFATGKVNKYSQKNRPLKKRELTEWESGKAEADAERWTEEAMDDVDMASGGRVPFVKGKLAKYTTPEGLAELIEKLFPKTTKVGQTSRPMAPKTELKRAIAGFQERQKNKIISHAGDAPKAGEGRFTKAEAIIMRLENTIKGSKGKKDKESKYVLETFPNFIKEIKAKPELANNQNVWDNLMGDLPKDQQFVIYGDDTVDFFTQSKFGPHNIASKKAFHQKHPYLTEKEAIKISTMEPTDQVMELKRLETIRRTKHASGGRVSLSAGGLAGMLGE